MNTNEDNYFNYTVLSFTYILFSKLLMHIYKITYTYIYIYVCICMYVYIYVYIYIYIYICIYNSIHIYACAYVCVCARARVCACTYIQHMFKLYLLNYLHMHISRFGTWCVSVELSFCSDVGTTSGNLVTDVAYKWNFRIHFVLILKLVTRFCKHSIVLWGFL